MDLLFDINVWASLATLAALEIVLGIDNIVVLSVMTDRLPPDQAQRARQIGLIMALGFRLVLLSLITWITRLTAPVIAVQGFDLSWRDLILIGGGLFLIVKAIQEVHAMIEGEHEKKVKHPVAKTAFSAVIAQIALMDVVFSLDSIITAVGMAQKIEVMIAAILIAMAIMYFAADIVSAFLKKHPTTKMLALCFLILIGVALVADGLGFHIPRGYIYFGMFFAALVETFNILAKPSTPLSSKSLASIGSSGKPLAGKTPATSKLDEPKGKSVQALPVKTQPKIQPGRQVHQGQKQPFGAKRRKRAK